MAGDKSDSPGSAEHQLGLALGFILHAFPFITLLFAPAFYAQSPLTFFSRAGARRSQTLALFSITHLYGYLKYYKSRDFFVGLGDNYCRHAVLSSFVTECLVFREGLRLPRRT